MIRNILTLIVNDLFVAYKNKSVYLILFVPLFVFISLRLVDKESPTFKKITIGLIQNETYPSTILHTITSADKIFTSCRVSDKTEGAALVKAQKIDCLLIKSPKDTASVILVVLKKESMTTLSIVKSFEALQMAVERKGSSWIADVSPIQEGGIEKQTLPTWIIMLVLLVGFMILPAQVAEEKEKKLLFAFLQTPMREIEWLVSKVVSGMLLTGAAVLFLHLIGTFECGNVLSYIAFIVAGGFCFCSYGVFLGFLCRTQASARTLGVIFYLPHLLPSALSDYSHKLNFVAPILPSYQLFGPVRSILLEQSGMSTLFAQWLYLLVVGSVFFYLAYVLMKKRYLM